MRIFTSYFDNVVMLQENDIVLVGICCYPPKYLDIKNIKYVAPTPEILQNYKYDYQEYIKHYSNILNNLDVHRFMDDIQEISEDNGGRSIALCCYERPGDFCHRHLLAEYLNKSLNIDIHEFSAKDIITNNELF